MTRNNGTAVLDGTAVVASTVVGRSTGSEIVPVVAVISAVLASVVATWVVAVSVAVTSTVEADSTTVVASVLTASVAVLVNASEEADDRVKIDVTNSVADSTDEDPGPGVCQFVESLQLTSSW